MSALNHCMVDIETTGTRPGYAVLSIAAVPFDAGIVSRREDCFYERIDLVSCLDLGLFIDNSTMRWWETQSDAARAEAFGGTALLGDVLQNLSDYLACRKKDIQLWGNGATFDLPMLEAAYAAASLPVPWTYKQARCYRTLNALAPAWTMPQAMAADAKHNALEDALFQAQRAAATLKWLKGK